MPKIPAIDDFRFGKTVNEPKTLGTTAISTRILVAYYHQVSIVYWLVRGCQSRGFWFESHRKCFEFFKMDSVNDLFFHLLLNSA